MIPFKAFMAIMTLVHQVGITDVQFDPKESNKMILTVPQAKWEAFADCCAKGDRSVCTFIHEHLTEFTVDGEKKECKMVYKFKDLDSIVEIAD